MEYRIVEHNLIFKKPAKTSRNVFKTRTVHYVLLLKDNQVGIGEAAPLELLSIDDRPDYREKLEHYCQELTNATPIEDLELDAFPSIRFGLETAMRDLNNGGQRQIFDTPFFTGTPIPINGLVWMADIPSMYEVAMSKIAQGFTCIKFKVGAHDFDEECKLLESMRSKYDASQLEIRLDANGAFLPDEASEQLKDLSRFNIHSIEQPVKPALWDDMAKLCQESKIDIALDEELIGLNPFIDGQRMLQYIKPQYLILKPNLIGGYAMGDAWVRLAQQHNANWWATSALESNIGLNGIAQWVSQYELKLPQGLGTGSLFANNIEGPLAIVDQKIVYGEKDWALEPILNL